MLDELTSLCDSEYLYWKGIINVNVFNWSVKILSSAWYLAVKPQTSWVTNLKVVIVLIFAWNIAKQINECAYQIKKTFFHRGHESCCQSKWWLIFLLRIRGWMSRGRTHFLSSCLAQLVLEDLFTVHRHVYDRNLDWNFNTFFFFYTGLFYSAQLLLHTGGWLMWTDRDRDGEGCSANDCATLANSFKVGATTGKA